MNLICLFADSSVFKKIINDKSIGIYFIGQHYSFIDFLILPFYFLKYIKSYYRRSKILKEYNKLGLNEIYCFEPNLILFLKYFSKTFYLFKKLKEKRDVLNLSYEGLKLGDLVYDTYMRMFNRPTIKLDLSLFLLINRTISEFEFLKKLNLNPSKYHTYYTTYTSNGIPFRFFLRTRCKCISHSLTLNGKIHYKDDLFHFKNFKKFKVNFQKINNKKKAIQDGLNYLSQICEGNLNYFYMSKSAYNMTEKFIIPDIVGVVFIHDLFDSQYIYGNMLFPDFYSWLIFTLEFVNEKKLKIGFKEHPNQNKESKNVIKKLKRKYNKNIWIDSRISNKELLNSKIKFGVSVYGTVLTELAFKNIKPISCGDNVMDNYNFVFKAETIKQYENFLLYPENLKFSQNKNQEIGEFVYMNYLDD